MSQIKPTVGYVNAWHAVNEANTPKMGYSSLTAFKQERFSNNVEAVYSVRRRGPLSQLLHSFMWAVSPGYRDKKLENRHALLNMIEDEIRTSSGSQAKYSRQGLKSYQGQEAQENQIRTIDDRPSQAHREVWANGQPPAGLSEHVSTALKKAERNVGNRQAFLDSLHRVFIAAAAEIAPDQEIRGNHGEPPLLTESFEKAIVGARKSKEVVDIRVAMLEKADPQETTAQLDVAIRNEYSKSRHTRGGRINPAAFQSAIARQTEARTEREPILEREPEPQRGRSQSAPIPPRYPTPPGYESRPPRYESRQLPAYTGTGGSGGRRDQLTQSVDVISTSPPEKPTTRGGRTPREPPEVSEKPKLRTPAQVSTPVPAPRRTHEPKQEESVS